MGRKGQEQQVSVCSPCRSLEKCARHPRVVWSVQLTQSLAPGYIAHQLDSGGWLIANSRCCYIFLPWQVIKPCCIHSLSAESIHMRC